MDEAAAKKVTERLLSWYSDIYRPLPWRQDPTPYKVWISEIMLQQTRIEAVLPYYNRFLEAAPDVRALAALSEDALLKLWEGLGYYSRARNLQKAARLIVDEYGGELPADYDRLLSLPGIGVYTAGAIASIAFRIPVPAVDGNVMRVLARLTADDTDVLSTAGKRVFTDLAWQLVSEEQPDRFNQALMELGERVCLPNARPDCSRCPLSDLCEAHRLGCETDLPVRAPKKARRIENRLVAVVRVAGEPPRVLLHKRPSQGLLADMWELPNGLVEESECFLPQVVAAQAVRRQELPSAKHIFSHVEWHMHGVLYDMTAVKLPADYRAVTWADLQSSYALPSAFRAYTALLPSILEGEY